jgi:hypothetical protein
MLHRTAVLWPAVPILYSQARQRDQAEEAGERAAAEEKGDLEFARPTVQNGSRYGLPALPQRQGSANATQRSAGRPEPARAKP